MVHLLVKGKDERNKAKLSFIGAPTFVKKNLAQNPRPAGCEKLTGYERCRLRQGKYRIVYSIQDEEMTVWVVKIGHRKDVYRRES
ncbi:type II toxin-antitoxin system RelE/ParE family toxin [Candidatus Poribacteria bacterium]|nr:type II toxin-antitoxin system RelE/ParE family toxin [Candidatus Poribacteria bacterium]